MSAKDDNESDYSEGPDYSNEENSDAELRSSLAKSPKSRTSKKKAKSSIKQRPKSATGVYGRTSQELWLSSLKNGRKNGLSKRTPTEYWSETLNKTGMGYTSQTARHNSFTGLKKSEKRNMAYGSTSHYMRQTLGLEKPRKSADGPMRVAPGTPAYKSPEEYYDDILELKKNIAALAVENSNMKSKVRRLEEDNIKKEKEIKQLLDPGKSEELRRTLGDRKPDSGSMVHSLKQKILKLEHQLKEKETAYGKLQSDLKTTKVEEMRMQLEVLYNEVTRLSQLKPAERSRGKVHAKENHSKVKALQEMVKTLNDKNIQLRDTNQSLKQDLNKLMEEKEQQKDKKREYEEMDRKQLLTSLARMEKKLERAEHDNVSMLSELDSKHSEQHGKITLEGTAQQRLEQLSKRETELLEELNKNQNSIKRLQMDRIHYKKKCDEKDKEIKQLKRDIIDLQDELQTFYDKDKTSTPRSTPRSAVQPPKPAHRASISGTGGKNKSPRSRSRSPSVDSADRDHDRERQRADAAAQRRRVQQFKEQRSAKTIQRSWRAHHKRDQEEQMDRATELIQSSMRGHAARKEHLRRYTDSEYSETQTETELDEAAEIIQASFRSHANNKQYLQNLKEANDNRSGRHTNNTTISNRHTRASHTDATSYRSSDVHSKRRQSQSPKFHEDSDDEVDVRSHRSGYSQRSHGRISPAPNRHSPSSHMSKSSSRDRLSPYNHSGGGGAALDESDEDDSDGDIVLASSSRGKRY